MKRSALFLLLLSASALADPSRLYLGSGIRSGGPIREEITGSTHENEYTQAAPAFSLQLEIPDGIDTDMHFYASHSAHSMKPISDEKIALTHLQLGGVKYIEPGNKRPYLGATLGGSYIQTTDIQQLRPSFSLYGGGHWSLNKQTAVKLEARWLGVFFHSDTSVLCDSGCTVKIKSGVWSQFEIGAWLGFGF